MNKLGHKQELVILGAIEQAAELVNTGTAPNEAIIKAAGDANIPNGQLELMVHAYNTGRTTRQRQQGEDLFEKSADFVLADIGVIREALYPSTVKTAAAVRRSEAISLEYAVTPTGMLQRHEKSIKQAAARLAPRMVVEAPPNLPPLDPVSVVKRAHNRVRENTRQIEESRRVRSHSFDKMAARLERLVDYFKSSGAVSYGDACQSVETLLGPAGVLVMQKVAFVEPRLAKQAARGLPTLPINHTIIHMAEGLREEVVSFQALDAAYHKTAAELAADSEVTLRPFVQPPCNPSQSILDEVSWDKSAGISQPFAFGMAGGIAKDLVAGVSNQIAPDDDKMLARSMRTLTDPKHEASLRNIRTQAVLQDLMANDPVVSGYDPEEVLGAFNEIGEIAPRMIDQKAMMQTLMRTRLEQGSLDQFQLDQMLGMDSKLRDRDNAKYTATTGP